MDGLPHLYGDRAGVSAGIPEGSIVSEPLMLSVDRSLKWDPNSFGWNVKNSAPSLAAEVP